MSPWDEQSVLRGSPLYMAPEMVCRRQYDSRVDLWSVGVILYGEHLFLICFAWCIFLQKFKCNKVHSPVCLLIEALFGRAPFASKSYSELVEKIRSNQPVEVMNMLLIMYAMKWLNSPVWKTSMAPRKVKMPTCFVMTYQPLGGTVSLPKSLLSSE